MGDLQGESGKGRCDLFVKPISRKKEAFIIEFKVAKKLKNLAARTALSNGRIYNYIKKR